ncbi:LORF2 protein, partial [Crocuta crocuta]
AIALLDIYQRILLQMDTCTLMLTAAVSATAKLWKQPKCPLTGKWIKKIHIHTHTLHEYYSAIRKNEILPFVMAWMELESMMLTEMRERQ